MSETRTKQPSCNLFANSPQNDCHVPESYQLRANPIFGSPRSPSILPRRRWTDRNLDIIDDVKIPFPTSKTSHKCWLESVAATETTRSRSIGSATCVCENLVSLSPPSFLLHFRGTLPFARFARSIQFTFSSDRKESTPTKGKNVRTRSERVKTVADGARAT